LQQAQLANVSAESAWTARGTSNALAAAEWGYINGTWVRSLEASRLELACVVEVFTNYMYLLLWTAIALTTLRAKLSGAVYCYRSCLCVCNGRAGGVFVYVGLLPR